MHRLHVLKVPTTLVGYTLATSLFPYTHYADAGHDPLIEVVGGEKEIMLRCRDVAKLHPNYQSHPRNRLDIYMPGDAAFNLALDIVAFTGARSVPELAAVDPEAYRRGPQTLPKIQATRRASCSRARATIAGIRVHSGPTPVYVDNETPNEGHVEMKGPEIHLGIPLNEVDGVFDPSSVRNSGLWQSPSMRTFSPRTDAILDRPAPTTPIDVEIVFGTEAAAVFAACLLAAARSDQLSTAAPAWS